MELVHDEIYDSSRLRSPAVEELSALWRYRGLIVQFITRSIKTRYKRSILGVVWTMLNPLLTMIVLTLVFSVAFRFPSIQNYAVYVLSGLIMWSFFSHATNTAMGEMIWSSSLLNRIYMPRSAFTVAAVGTAMVNLLISLAPLLIIALLFGVRLTPALLVLPFSILLLGLFALGVGLFLATAVIYFADMVPVYEVLLTIWMYATPIIYPVDFVPPQFSLLIKLNPMYYLLQVFRMPVYDGVLPDLKVWAIAAALAFGSILIGGYIFTSKANEFAYRV